MANPATFQGSVPINYDQYLGPLFFEPYAVDLVHRYQTLKVNKVLELACGTGRLTQHLLQLLDLDGVLYATDLNEDMLTVAKNKIQDPRIQWQVVDAKELPYENDSFELVVCQFGVMFFPDKIKAFKEALRVLQPEGTFLFLTWDDVAHNTVSNETQNVLQRVFPEDPPAFFKNGPYSYSDKDVIIASLREAGFQNIEITPVTLTGKATTVDDVITGILDGSPLALYLEERRADKEPIREQLQRSLSAYYKDNGFSFSMQALYCKGVK